MAETIVPVVHGKRSRYRIALALHVIAAGLAAALFGTVAGTIGMLLGAPWDAVGAAGAVGAWSYLLVGALAVIYALREAFGIPIPLFDRRRQVPDWWRTFYGPMTTAVLYGAGLGIGFLTYLRHGTFVVVTAAALAFGDPLLGAALCAPFGLARGLTALVSRQAASGEDTAAIVTRLEEVASGNSPRIANGLALAGLALAGAAGTVL
jgi:hypothetical protein